MSAAGIADAMFRRLDGLGLPYPIAWEDRHATPPQGPYIEARIAFGDPQRIGISSTLAHRRPGYMQVSLFWPRGRGASIAAKTVADQIAAHFPVDARYGAARISRAPHVPGGFQDGSRWHEPVTINFEALV